MLSLFKKKLKDWVTAGSIPGPGTSACHGCGQKRKNKIKKAKSGICFCKKKKGNLFVNGENAARENVSMVENIGNIKANFWLDSVSRFEPEFNFSVVCLNVKTQL